MSNKQTRKVARQARLAEDRKVRKQAILSGIGIMAMYGGFFAYFT